MSNTISRRDMLKLGLATGTGAMLLSPVAIDKTWAAGTRDHFCVVLCNHWSYIGIGWQLGLESIVLSVTDAMETADREPHVKTCINFDARAFELLAKKFPEVAERLKDYLAAGKVEIIAGTYGQPLGTTVSGESNIRQIVLGRETIRKALNHEVTTFLEEEEFSHPQLPQLAAAAEYRNASLAQCDTWGRAGIPVLEYNAIRWKGIDGTTIPCVPKNSLFPITTGNLLDLKRITASPEFKKLQTLGVPLIFTWEEFGWEDPEHPAFEHASEKYKVLADQFPVEFVTLKEYHEKYAADPKETVFLPMDAWGKSLTWGLGGDQVRILDRKVQGILLAAEIFDAAATAFGARSLADSLEQAWKDLLASQSHDVGLCEYSRQGGRMAPLERIEDYHNRTWGNIGFDLLDAAQKQGQAALDATLKTLTSQIDSKKEQQGKLAVTVFNPLDKDRTDVAFTGRIYPLPKKTKTLLVKDRTGRTLPSQVVRSKKDNQGNLVMAELAFPVSSVPSAGYDTYYLELAADAARTEKTDLTFDESKLLLENEHLRVKLDPQTGAIASLVHKASGREMIDEKRGAFPHFSGRPNPNLSLRPQPPERYDSAKSQAQLDWYAKGPLFATVRAQHHWKYLNFETRVTLAAGRPYVEVVSRIFSQVPPLFVGGGDHHPPLMDTNSGYWLSWAPAFEVSKILRDYPFAVDETKKDGFHALTFADLVGKDVGLLVLHPGTQWFIRDKEGIVSNLLMKEWESFWSGEYGWPLYSEYRHALMPHAAGELNNAARLRAAAELTQPLLCRVGEPQTGDLPPSNSFVRVAPENLMLSAFRKKTSSGLELRVVETDGQAAEARIEIGLPAKGAIETNLLGRKIGEVLHSDSKLAFHIDPWKIRTFEVT